MRARWPEETGDLREDVQATVAVLETVRDEILDEALSGNIKREHHFDAAFEVFQDIKALWRAQRILEEFAEIEGDEVTPEDTESLSRFFKGGGS